MTPLLDACPTCGAHRRLTPGPCPHCGAAAARTGLRPNVLVLGLALAGCAVTGGETGKDTGAETADTADTSTCGPSNEQPEYGGPYVDDDGDGFLTFEDCNDADTAVNPCAAEAAGDGVDSNCNGSDDT